MTSPESLGSHARYAHEFERRLRVGLVGCGGQALRNILPSLRFAPVDLVALVDIQIERAQALAPGLGVERTFADHRALLDEVELDAVFFATGYDERGEPLYPRQASDALAAGCHAWIEKPPAARVADVEMLHERARAAGRQVGVGLMKMFAPAVRQVANIVGRPEFGRITSVYLRDPEQLPPREVRGDLTRMRWVLDHVVHPASVLQAVAGPVRRIYVEEEPGGASMVTLKFRSGACGVLHQSWGQSGTCPKERLEVVGSGANVRIDNNIRITYYRPGSPGAGKFVYGRTSSFISPDDETPLHWEMDAYSGQPLNTHVFYQGYAPAIRYFCEQLLAERDVEIAGLADAWHVTRLFEALCQVRDGEVLDFGEPPAWTLTSRDESPA